MNSLGNKIVVGNVIDFDGNANITLVIIPKAENIEFSCTIVE